mgnify:CR=1 FL=1
MQQNDNSNGYVFDPEEMVNFYIKFKLEKPLFAEFGIVRNGVCLPFHRYELPPTDGMNFGARYLVMAMQLNNTSLVVENSTISTYFSINMTVRALGVSATSINDIAPYRSFSFGTVGIQAKALTLSDEICPLILFW